MCQVFPICTKLHGPGGGIARRCEAAGGERVEFSDYILEMWAKIGYSPQEVEIASLYDEHNVSGDISPTPASPQEGGMFTPPKAQNHSDKFEGVILKNIPRDSDTDSVFQILHNSGLPQELNENVTIKDNGKVIIDKLDNTLCQQLVKNMHRSKFFETTVLCFGIVPLTPTKVPENIQAESDVVMNGPLPVMSSDVTVFVPPPVESEVVVSVSEPAEPVPPPGSAAHPGTLQPPASSTQQPESRRSVRDIVTDFSSCLSDEEGSPDVWAEAVTRRKLKKRKANTSPLSDKTVSHSNYY